MLQRMNGGPSIGVSGQRHPVHMIKLARPKLGPSRQRRRTTRVGLGRRVLRIAVKHGMLDGDKAIRVLPWGTGAVAARGACGP